MSKKAPSGSKHGGSAKSQNPSEGSNKANQASANPGQNQGPDTPAPDKKTQEQQNADLEQQYKETLTERD